MKKVLLVNDCKFESAVMRDKLERLNFEVSISGEADVHKRVLQYAPDIVISNLIMRKVKGDALLKSIKESNKNIAGILSSCNPIKKEDFDSRYVDDIINTPIDDEKLKKIMDKYTSNKTEERKYLFCPYCGKSLNEENQSIRFCPYCGSILSNLKKR